MASAGSKERIAIRNLTLADSSDADRILSAAFDGMHTGGIVAREVALAPKTCWIAFAQEQAAGLVCAVVYDHMSYIGPMAVAPEFQGKGIGRLLFERLLNSLASAGCTSMLLDATDAGEPLYRRFGFVEMARTLDMRRTPGSGGGANGSGQIDDALRLDREIFGANREPSIRRFVEEENAMIFTRPHGFLIAQTKVLGPFAAKDASTAGVLADEALIAGVTSSRALAPVENPFGIELLEKRGFIVEREVKHMRLGKPVALRRDLIYGLASFALG